MLSVNLPRFEIDGKVILQDISFRLHEGENLTVLGANGVGKSTLARVLCGLYHTQKSVFIEETPIEQLPASKRAMLLNYIPPKLSIYDTFIRVDDFLGLSRYRGTLKAQKLHEVLALLGLEQFQESFCSRLSSGEQQLLLVASALMHEAKITIFDEPTSNLDPVKTQKIFHILQSDRLAQKVVITHDLQFAYKLGYPVLYLHEGKGLWFESASRFFAEENLQKIFKGSVAKTCDNVTVVL